MAKKPHPAQVADSETCVSDFTTITLIKPTSRIPKKHRARSFMLLAGVDGWTENDILKYCRLSSGRNYASELERSLNIRLERIDEKNPDGVGSHFRYRITCRADAMRIIQLINNNAIAGGYDGLSQQTVTDILTLYPDVFTAE